jgi:hypothetical protein
MKEWKYLIHLLYVFFYDHIFYKLYMCTKKNQYYEKQDFNERRNNASTILTTSSHVYTESHLSN